MIKNAKTPEEMLDNLVNTYVDNPQLNSLRTAHGKKMMRTTSQIMLIPSEHTMFIRPVQSHITFNFWKLNNPKHKLWVELLSNRILYSHKSEYGEPPFPRMNHES